MNNLNNLKNASVYITLTGGGSRFISNILSAGGASWFFEGCEIPYSTDQIDKLIGYKPTKYTSHEVLLDLARNSIDKIADSKKEIIGVGITAVLNKVGGQREGRRNFIRIRVANKFDQGIDYIINLDQSMTREEQEDSCAKIVFDILSKTSIEKNVLTFFQK